MGIVAEVAGVGAAGLTSSITGGLTIAAELRWPSFSIGLEGQGDFPTTSTVGGGGSVQVSALFATVAPCFRLRYFGACALVAGGATEVNGIGLVQAAHTAAPLVAVGARALGELQLVGPLSLRLQADLLAPLARTTVYAGNDVVWTTPTLGGEAALALAVRLR